MNIHTFKEYWQGLQKGESYRFSAVIEFSNGHKISHGDIHAVGSTSEEARQDVIDSLNRDFKYQDVKEITVTLK
jgi:hypothetical protein